MKKISRITIPALLLLSFIAPACGEFEEIDLPEKIVLPKEGGKLYIYSKSGIYGISLDNAGVITTDRRYHYGDREPPLSLDTLTSGWLKVVNPRTCRNEFYFIAEPNTTGRRRTIYLNGMVMNCSFSRMVVQDK